MLPDFLRPSYRRYKDDTDRFAFWLVNTARRCGHQASPAKSPDTAWPEGRPAESRYRATTNDLLNFGQAIASSALHVPASIIAVGRRAARLRRDVTSHLWGQGNAASNMRHAHFSQVLDDICDALEPRAGAAAPDRNPDGKTSSPIVRDRDGDAQAWLNRFAALTVEELEGVPESLSGAGEIVKVEVVEEDDATSSSTGALTPQAFLRLLCLFHDLQNWRAFISETWREYRDLKIDLMTASIVTDGALQLARELVDEVVDSWPRELPDGDLELQESLYTAACVAREVNETPSPGLTFNAAMADIADWCYIPTATLLRSLVPVIQADSVPVLRPGALGTYDPNADRAGMSVVERFDEDKLLLMELLPELCMMHAFNMHLPVSDEITAGLLEFVRDRRPSLWLSFAAQILLDTNHIMRSSRLGAFGDLRMSGLRIARTIEDFWKLSETHPKPQFWPKEGDKEVREIRRCIETLIELDPLLVLQQAAAAELSRPEQEHPDHLLFTRNAVLCGAVMTHLNLRMQKIGQSLVNQWYDVQQMAFLYNLVQQAPG